MTHFEERHSNVNLDDVLGKPARSRRRSTIIGRDPPLRSPRPAIEPDRLGQDETWRPPLTLPSSAVVTVPSRKREDSCLSEYSDALDAPSAFLSTEVRAQSVTDVGGKIGFVYPFW